MCCCPTTQPPISPRQRGYLLNIVAAINGVIYLLPAVRQLWRGGDKRQGDTSQLRLSSRTRHGPTEGTGHQSGNLRRSDGHLGHILSCLYDEGILFFPNNLLVGSSWKHSDGSSIAVLSESWISQPILTFSEICTGAGQPSFHCS